MKMRSKRLAGLMVLVLALAMLSNVALPAVAETAVDLSAIPSVSAYDANDIKTAYKIEGNADLNAVAAEPGKFGAGITLYLAADITLTAADEAYDSLGCHAAIDGLDHTITGAVVNGTGWLAQNYAGSFVRNLTLRGWSGSKSARDTGLLIGNAACDDITLENIKVDGCTVSGGQLSFGLLVGAKQPDVTGEIIRFRNITVTKSTVHVSSLGRDGVGFLIGRITNSAIEDEAYYGAASVFENIYFYDNKITGAAAYTDYSHQGIGIVAGRLHSCKGDSASTPAATFKNIAVFNTDITVSETNPIIKGVLMGGVGGANYASVENVVAADNDADGLIYARSSAATRIAVTNVATDTALLQFGSSSTALTGVANPNAGDTEAVLDGSLIYTLNEAVDHDWAIVQENGKIYAVAADAEHPAPRKNTLQITVLADNSTRELPIYSDTEGRLLNKEAYEPYAVWNGALDKVYPEAAVITANHSCRHYDAVDNEDGTHSYFCKYEFCNHTTVQDCADSLKQTGAVKATCEQAGYTEYTCRKCGAVYQKNVTTVGNGAHAYAENGWYAIADGLEGRPCLSCDHMETRTAAASGLTVTAGRLELAPSAEAQTVRVPLTISGNTGLAGLQLKIELLNVLNADGIALTAIENGELFDLCSTLDEEDTAVEITALGDTFYILLADLGNVTADGTAATLVFSVPATESPAVLGLGVSVADAPNATDGGQVTAGALGGAVEVVDYTAGDVNNDDKVNITDAVALLKFVSAMENYRTVNWRAGDVDSKTGVSAADLTHLMRYLTGWKVTLGA